MSQPRALMAVGIAFVGLGCAGQVSEDAAPTELIKTTVVTKNPDGSLSRTVHFLTAAQMENERQQRAAWIDEQARGLLADLDSNETCPINNDDIWVYAAADLKGSRCCIRGVGSGYFSDICGPGWNQTRIDGGPIESQIRSLWAGLPYGYVRNDNDCAEAYGPWDKKSLTLCQPYPNWIDVGETFCGLIGEWACNGGICYEGRLADGWCHPQ